MIDMLRHYWLEFHVVNADKTIAQLLLHHLRQLPCFSYEKLALSDVSFIYQLFTGIMYCIIIYC